MAAENKAIIKRVASAVVVASILAGCAPGSELPRPTPFETPEPRERGKNEHYEGALPIEDGITLRLGNWSGGLQVTLRVRKHGVPIAANCSEELDELLPRSVKDNLHGTLFGCDLAFGSEGETLLDHDGDGVDETKDCFADTVYRCSEHDEK